MQSLATTTGELAQRPICSLLRLVASTSPCCSPATHPKCRKALRLPGSLLTASSFCPTWPGCSRFRVSPSASHDALLMAAASSRQEVLAGGDLSLDDQDAVAAAEVGGRNYLQLSDLSDESLQVRMVQWYPGHIARAERQLKAQLGMVDVVLEVHDARIPVSTHHPQIAAWVGPKPRLLLMNRADEVSEGDLAAWRAHFRATRQHVFWTDGRNGDGIRGVKKELLKVAAQLNSKRAKRGLQPRPVRACVIGFPNIGKSAIINRLVNRRAVASAPKPGVTRQLRWVRVDEQLDLLDAPGVIPASFRDQLAAQRLAMCNDIGEAAYLASAVAAALVLRIKQLAAGEAAAVAAAATATMEETAVAAEEGPVNTAAGASAAEEEELERRGGGRQGGVVRGVRRGGTGGGQRKVKAKATGGASGGGGGGRGGGGGTHGAHGASVMVGVLEAIRRRYSIDPLTVGSAEDFLEALAVRQYGGDVERAGVRLLTDYRAGALGRFALELPPDLFRRERREAELQAAAARREREQGVAGVDQQLPSTTEADEIILESAVHSPRLGAVSPPSSPSSSASTFSLPPSSSSLSSSLSSSPSPSASWGMEGNEVGEDQEVNSGWVRQAEAWAAQNASLAGMEVRQ